MKPFIWTDSIDSEFSRKLIKYALAGGRELYLNSYGGDCGHMCAALDLMEPGGWTVVASGAIMSAAVPILAVGDKGCRVCTSRTRFMIHLPKIWSFGASTSDELKTESEELTQLEELYCGVLGRHTKKPASFWSAKVKEKKDWYFGAAEALKFGLVDEIAAPNVGT